MARHARALQQSRLWEEGVSVVQVKIRRSSRVREHTRNPARRKIGDVGKDAPRNTYRSAEPPRSLTEHIDRKRVLSVTDLVAASWCEYAHLYNVLSQSHLPLSLRPSSITTPEGNVITPSWAKLQQREEIMQRGAEVHDVLERQVQPIRVEFRLVTPGDRWALQLLQFASGIAAARSSGCAREIPVFGYVHGRLVRGIIDEVRRETSTLQLSDTKTRKSWRLPTEADQIQARLQVMLYKRLADGLYLGITGQETKYMDQYAEPVVLQNLCATLNLDIDSPLSKEFTEDVRTMIETTITPWSLSDVSSLTLRTTFALARQALEHNAEIHIRNRLEIAYVRPDQDATPVGSTLFDAQPKYLQDYLEEVFSLFQGVRAPQGVGIQATRRCESCAWREGCEWRERQANKALAKTQTCIVQTSVASDDMLWDEFDIPEQQLTLLDW
ncbi:hypothetical protein MPSI1_002072 [Malassezia psittaci]|uniref:Uncharacterized protein n=1 Tax=Malassezia psittaci TaxID=1821823 RepID=A0AAF0JKI2_9BASI|nr:hypothetical protein MPSI1_002072 [Malassezia psittaci]